MKKRLILFYGIFFIIFINCFSFVSAGSVPLDVSIRVVEKVEQGDLVEILGGEFESERAEVMEVNDEGQEAVIRLVGSQEFLTISLKDLEIVEKVVGAGEGLAVLKLDKELISRLLAGVIVVLIILLSKEKGKKKILKRKMRKKKRTRKKKK